MTAAKFFSRPVTELEIIITNLRVAAERIGSQFGNDKELHVINGYTGAHGGAGFDPKSGRVGLILELTVSEIADPWKETYDKVIESFYNRFYFPPKDWDPDARLGD